MSDWSETLARIDALRERGARRVVIDGIEVEFGPRTSPPTEAMASTPEVDAAEKKRIEDETMYWSSGSAVSGGETR